MGGLMRGLAGALKGIGDGMIDRAKSDREAAIVALARQNAVDDREAGFAHADKSQNVTEAGADRRLGVSEDGQNTRLGISETGANTRLDTSEAGQNTRLGISEAGANTRSAASEAGANSRNAATIKGASDLQDKAAGQFTDIKANGEGYVAFDKKGNGKVITDQNGQTIQPPDSKVSATVATAIIKAYTTKDADDNPIIVNKDQMFADLQKAEQHYGKTPASPLYLNSTGGLPGQPTSSASTMSNLTQPASGGLTSNIFGGTAAPADSNPAGIAPPKGAVDMLKANPGMKAAFDQKYGQGAATRALGE